MQSRRSFMAGSLAAGIAGGALPTLARGATAPQRDQTPAYDPWQKLRAISANAKQLWPVVYVDPSNLESNLERDIETAFAAGCDAVVLELGRDPATLERAIAHARSRYPSAKIGANYLGGDGDERGFINGFRLAKAYNLDICWTDFCGVDLIEELPEISLHQIEAARAPNAFYVSGIQMKYGTMQNPDKPIEQSALQAMGWVEGLVVTGPRTGVPTDPERARRARAVIGSYPMGAASGVAVDNFHTIRDYVDFCLVNTSISDANHRLLPEKVRALREVMR